MSAPALEILREPARAAALLDPERQRLLEALAAAPDSAAGLARRLGETRQRLNYHLRLLEQAGLVALAQERQKGNCTERVMRLVARRFVLDPGAAGRVATMDPEDVSGDRLSAAYLLALATRAIREVAHLLHRARAQRARVATTSVNAMVRLGAPADFPAFAADLARAVAAVVAKHHQDSGRWFRVVAGAYPGPRPHTRHGKASHD